MWGEGGYCRLFNVIQAHPKPIYVCFKPVKASTKVVQHYPILPQLFTWACPHGPSVLIFIVSCRNPVKMSKWLLLSSLLKLLEETPSMQVGQLMIIRHLYPTVHAGGGGAGHAAGGFNFGRVWTAFKDIAAAHLSSFLGKRTLLPPLHLLSSFIDVMSTLRTHLALVLIRIP